MMNIRRYGIGALVFLGLLFLALVATSPVQAQESNPEGLVFSCLTDAGYEVLDVYGDEDAAMVLMQIVSDEWDEDLRTQIVWGWYCLYPAYEDSESLVTGLAYEERYILAFFVGRADFGDWLDGEMSDSEFASAYAYGVYDTEIGDWISETDFIHTYFPGAEPTIEEEGLIPRPGQQPGEPAFSDDFSDDDSGLNPHFEDEEHEVGYSNGEYHISVLVGEWTFWQYYPDLEFDDFAVQVQARLVGGSGEGYYGLLIRVDPDTHEYYLFGISPDGYYEIYERHSDGWTELVGWTQSRDIRGDGEWDLLRVEASGSTMSFLANGEPLATVDDDSFTTGTIALFAGTFEDAEIDVAFDNLTLWTEQAPSEGWSLVMQDDFSDDDSGWPAPLDDPYCQGDYDDDEYHVENNSDEVCGVTFPEVYSDFAFEVDARQVEGPDDGYYGIIFRAYDTDDPFRIRHYYYFVVNHDEGRYGLYKWDREWTELQEPTESTSVNLGEGTNRFRVEAVGHEITLYLNGDLLATVEDADAIADGRLGFALDSGQRGANHVAFDNLKLYEPEGPVTGERRFGPITWYQYVDEDGQWQDPVTEYPRGAPMIIAVWEYENMEDGLEWGCTWLHDGEVWGDWRDQYEWRGGESGEWGFWIYYDGDPLESGEWEVRFYVEGELMQSATTRIR